MPLPGVVFVAGRIDGAEDVARDCFRLCHGQRVTLLGGALRWPPNDNFWPGPRETSRRPTACWLLKGAPSSGHLWTRASFDNAEAPGCDGMARCRTRTKFSGEDVNIDMGRVGVVFSTAWERLICHAAGQGAFAIH